MELGGSPEDEGRARGTMVAGSSGGEPKEKRRKEKRERESEEEGARWGVY